MKILTVVSKSGQNLKPALKETERSLRGTTTTFSRVKEGHWKHIRYKGWVNWDGTTGGGLVAEVRSKRPEAEWQLLQAFIGYLDRHLGDKIQSVIINYR